MTALSSLRTSISSHRLLHTKNIERLTFFSYSLFSKISLWFFFVFVLLFCILWVLLCALIESERCRRHPRIAASCGQEVWQPRKKTLKNARKKVKRSCRICGRGADCLHLSALSFEIALLMLSRKWFCFLLFLRLVPGTAVHTTQWEMLWVWWMNIYSQYKEQFSRKYISDLNSFVFWILFIVSVSNKSIVCQSH